jgi:hypothetical protein
VGGNTGESKIYGGILRGALPQREKVGFGFVEAAGIVAVAQRTGQTQLILRVSGITGEGGTEDGDGVIVPAGIGGSETLRVQLSAAGLLIEVVARNQMTDCGEPGCRGKG